MPIIRRDSVPAAQGHRPRCLAADPKLLLMDEPFGAIDPINREDIQNEFLRVQERLKKTILFVTHDIHEAIKMGDKIAIFQEGSLVQYDTPETILTHPKDTYVADFVGADRALKVLGHVRCRFRRCGSCA
jgi:osmoprotectant transport system ATP-binding protein